MARHLSIAREQAADLVERLLVFASLVPDRFWSHIHRGPPPIGRDRTKPTPITAAAGADSLARARLGHGR